MKKIELKKTLEERVRDTEWTDANTWNVLRKIRGAKSLCSEFSLRRLAPAAVALLLVIGIGIATLTGTPGNPDSIRDKAQYTVQPMVTALSAGQGEGNGDLPEGEGTEKNYLDAFREYYPEVADQMMPVNLSSEKDGVRLEVVSGLVKDYESWIVYSAQDVEGKYPESMLRAICNDNVSGAEYGGETPFLFADEKEHKYYFCNHIVYDEPVNKADRLISVTMDSYEVQREVKLDLAQLLKEHGTTSEGVLSPELMPWITAEGPVPQGKVTVLDYNKPLNIPVLGDVLLTGAGWIDGKIHVQFHNPDAHGIPGERVSVLSNWIVSLYYDDEYWKEDLYDSALWDENGDDCNDWEEIILNCDQEYLEKMNAQVNVTVTDALVEKQMEVKVPLNLICGDVEPAEAEGAENLLDPDAAESIRQFFSFWAGRDAKYMIQPLSNNWHKSVADGFAFTHSLIASGTPRSYQINNVSGWSGDAERVVTCTVEMENPVGEEPMHRQYEFVIRKGEYWYEIDPTGFAHWKTGNYDPAVEMVYLDEESAVRDYLENNYGDYLTDRLVPINRSSENMGIRYELRSGFVTEDDGWFVCSVQDIAATDGAFPDKIWMDGDIGETESFSQMVMYRNAAEHKTVYLVYVKYKQPVEDENRTVSMNLQSVDVNREGAKADLVPLLKGYAKTVEGVELPQLAKAILEHRFTGPTEVPGLKALDYTKPQDIPLFKDTYLANAGWIDGKLHIQIRSTYKTKDGYTDLWFNTLLGGETEFLQKEMDYSPLDWYDDTAYWYEYVFDFAPEDLDKLEMTINCLFAQATLENVWNARFPLNTIYVKSKTDANEAWRTPLLDRVDEFFTAWQNGDTESMLAMCGAHWRDQQGILVRILDNRVPESWKVSEIRGLQTPAATVGIDIHMQPEETNGVYLVKMKKETDGIWYFEPDGLYVASDSDLLLLPGGMQDEEVILTGTPKNSEEKTEVPPFVGVVTDFLTCWNKGDTDGMLALCPPSMRDEGNSNGMKYFVTGFGKPLEWKLGQLYGAPGDETRGVACKIQFRLGNDDLAWYSFDIAVTKDANVQWYVNPNSLHEAASEITGTMQRSGKKAENNIDEDNQVEKEIIKRLNKFYSCWIQRDKEGMLALCKPKEDNSGYQNVTDYMLEFGILNGFDSGEIGETGDENTRNLHGIVSCRTGDGKDHLYSVDFKMEKADDGLWYVGLDEVTFGLIDTVENQGTSSGNGEAKAEPDIESILKELRPVNNYYEMTEQARMEVVAGLVKDNECWLEYSVETLDDRYTIPEKDLSWFATLYTGDHDNQFSLEPLQPAVCVSVDEAQHKATWLHGYKCYYPYKEVNLEDIYLMTGVSNLILQENGETGEAKDASIMAVTVPMNNISDHEIANMPDYMNPAPTPSPAPAERSGRPVRVGLELGKDTLSGPETIDVTITVTNVSGDTLAGPVTLYDPDGNQVAEYGNEDFAAGETKEWSGKWTVTEEQLADGKVGFSVKYSDYKEGTQDIMAHKLTFSKPITKE